MSDDLANVLALLDGGASMAESVEPETPPPPVGASPAAQAYWYAILAEQELTLSETVILEQICEARTMLDLLAASWTSDGQPTTAKGSMGQIVADPRIQEMRQVRAQLASLIRQLGAATDIDGQPRRRPGRPSRADAAAAGKQSKWGTAHA